MLAVVAGNDSVIATTSGVFCDTVMNTEKGGSCALQRSNTPRARQARWQIA